MTTKALRGKGVSVKAGQRKKRSKQSGQRSLPEGVNIAELYREHQDEVTNYVRRQFGNGPPDPEDVTQLAFQKIIEHENTRDIRDFGAYLRQTARNLFLKEIDRQRTRIRHEPEVEQLYYGLEGYEPSPETVISNREQLSAINEALDSMSKTRRRAFILHRVEGLSITETGRQLGISRPAASKHISVAMAKIDAVLAGADEPTER